MSFSQYKDTISEGDTVILFLGHSSMQSLVITADKVHQTKYGAFSHNDMIGKQFGAKMFSKNNKGWIYLLHPTPELWTVNLPHRTQILYSTDISMVIMQLGIIPGSVVLESGTGSASMSHALIRSIAPSGHLYTFEFHKERAKLAIKEFKDHGIDHLVTVMHRDVLADGFQLDHVADAVFLDLPSPWEAIETSKKALKKEGGRICSFSPCIEQVQKTCETLRSLEFKDIQVMECLVKNYEVRTTTFQAPDFGSKANQKLPITEQPNGTASERKRTHEKIESGYGENGAKVKCPKLLVEAFGSDLDPSTGLVCNTSTALTQKADRQNILTARPVRESPGHTGFLTFASLYPCNVTSADV